MAPQKLRDLIRSIRACKTAAEEREVIQKECALIRTAFRGEDNEFRCRNVAKLLYIHMLGYPAHFGQLECLKLVASPKFSDKRIGYLGTMMLLDELKDVHLLVTNSLKNDLNHQVQYVAGLALCCLGSICSSEMARDLAGEVEKLLKSTNSYVRKKAVLCALRIVRKVPDLMDNFVPATRALLGERNHGVLVTGVTLITEICRLSPDNLGHFRRLVPSLVRILKNLIVSGYSPEHDVGGITDPFLQVRILGLLRILGRGDREASETMTDILAQVATNTDSNKNVGNAILYEAVQCIMSINSETGLRVMAVNILGKFLQNVDRNIRYVALTTLLHTLQNEDCRDAVQRHRATVLECIKDPDTSIRRRALSLAFALVNESNAKSLVKELLVALDSAEPELKTYMARELLLAADKFAPSRRWHLDTILEVLVSGGNHVKDDAVCSVVALIANSPDLHAYVTQRFFTALQANLVAQPLVQVGSWCIGEYGHLLVGRTVDPEYPCNATSTSTLDLIRSILESSLSLMVTRDIALTALMKLSARFPDQTDRIRTMIGLYNNNVDVELQQRSSEFTAIFNLYNSLRPALLEQMPVPELKLVSPTPNGASRTASGAAGAGAGAGGAGGAPVSSGGVGVVAAPPPPAEPSLLDLLSDLGPGPAASLPSSAAPPPPAAAAGGMLDLLSGLDMGPPAPRPSAPPSTTLPPPAGPSLLDLMGLGGPSMPPPPSFGGFPPAAAPSLFPSAPPSASAPPSLLDLMGGPLSSAPAPSAPLPNLFAPAPPPSSSSQETIVVFEKDGLQVTFTLAKPPGGNLSILVSTGNSTPVPFASYVFQAAVPKMFQLQLQAQSGAVVPPNNGGRVTQVITVVNPQQQPLRMRLKITYTANGQPVTHTAEVNNIPAHFF